MLLANLTNIVGAMAENSRAIKKFEPIPAPRTAEGRVEAEESLKLTMSLIAQLTPYALDRG